jgi:hypothetical protein
MEPECSLPLPQKPEELSILLAIENRFLASPARSVDKKIVKNGVFLGCYAVWLL